MMNKVDGMKQEVYSKDWVMHTGMSDLCFFRSGRWGGRAMIIRDEERVQRGG